MSLSPTWLDPNNCGLVQRYLDAGYQLNELTLGFSVECFHVKQAESALNDKSDLHV